MGTLKGPHLPLNARSMSNVLGKDNLAKQQPNRDDEVLVRVENVSKKFCRSLKRSLWYGVQDAAIELTGRKSDHALRKDEFWAVKDVSFELRRGECLGLIGPNGAGKSTLLKMLNGLIKPNEGSITITGNVNALIALGAGFNPILTGRENIYVNASILGLSKVEIDAQIDEIIAFSEIEEFIDSPVQSYSSGMQVRLGFSIATALSPDILLLDEVLAVGDAKFRAKCYRRISELRRKAAIIFVSHHMEHVARICETSLVLNKGKQHTLGTTEEGIFAYESLNQEDGNEASFLRFHKPVLNFHWELSTESIESGSSVFLTLITEFERHIPNISVRIFIYNASGSMVAASDCTARSSGIWIHPGKNVWKIQVATIPLRRGRYLLALNLIDSVGDIIVWSYKQKHLQISSHSRTLDAYCQLPIAFWQDLTDRESEFSASGLF